MLGFPRVCNVHWHSSASCVQNVLVNVNEWLVCFVQMADSMQSLAHEVAFAASKRTGHVFEDIEAVASSEPNATPQQVLGSLPQLLMCMFMHVYTNQNACVYT